MMPSGMLVLVAVVLGLTPAAPPVRDSLLSRHLTLAALDQEAALNLDSALVLYRAARRADSTDVVAEFHYVALRFKRFELVALHDEYAASAAHWNPRSAFCVTPWVTGHVETRFNVSEVVSAAGASEATACSIAALGVLSHDEMLSAAAGLQYASRAIRTFPTVPLLWAKYALLLERSGQAARSEAVWLEGDRMVGHPLLRTQLAMSHIGTRLRLGDTAGARALQRVVRSAVQRDGRPGIVCEYLERVAGLPSLWRDEGGQSSIVERLLGISRASGDWAVAAQTLADLGKMFIDVGEPLRAIPLLTRAISMADSVQVSDLQLVVRTLRGRAYTKAGRLSNAEKDLLAALVAGESAARVYSRADAYHNLAHLYESEGRWPEAARAVDRFVVLARLMDNNGPEVTSLQDAGEIRWKAGWHASADVAFREMVRAAERSHNWYFAGRYFERAGDLDRAKSYYLSGIKQGASDPALLAGMTRVHAALGHADSAEVWAQAHDARMVIWTPLEVPLLPVVLARQGRFVEATRIAHSWVARQIRGGNVEGAAIATLQVAQFLLDAGHADSAFAEAERTDSLARTLNLTREMIRARVLRGTALIRLGKSDVGVRSLDSALALARRHPSADILFETHLALGEALAATGRIGGALHEYDLAALSVEHSTLSIAEDLDRAGYRERNLRPFDGATRVLLASGGRPRRTDELLRWSSRRNAAALALVASGSAGAIAHVPPPPDLVELESRLGTDEVLLNYIVLDSTVAAIVVVHAGARLVRLPISPATLRARIAEIRHPLVTTYSGRLDLVRARYAIGVAAELYEALIRPFARELAGKKRLLIASDGPLHALSFDGLVVSPGVGGTEGRNYYAAKYLLDSFEVEYLPSPAFLRPRRDRSRAQQLDAARLLAVGYGAPGSAAEIQALRDIWPRQRLTTIESGAATESIVKRRMAKSGVLHFAVHASADARDPLASNLRLVADSLDDGFLHTNEISAMRITADLVVLSACETNAGPIYNGEGVMGIARAFLVSGARAVVGTQWPIGAETAVLMREFYTRLARREAPAAALHAAKLMVRRSPGSAHPFHWAGFVLVR